MRGRIGGAALLCAAAMSACSHGSPRDAGASAPVDDGADVAMEIARVRAATAPFRSLEAAVAAGYPRTVAQCLSHPMAGAMGHHHVNRELLDDVIELEKPEILLYSRHADGTYVLNGVEYIVPYTARPRNATPPRVMDRELKRSDELQLWYLHAWVWTENPAGMFADWNPNVSCAG